MTRRVMILGDLADPNFGKVVEMTESEFIAFAKANTWPGGKASVGKVITPKVEAPRARSRPRKLDIRTMPMWAESNNDAVTE